MQDTLQFLILTVFLEATPGPAVLFMLYQSSLGPRYVWAAIAGLLSANVIWMSLVATGLAVLITQSPWLFLSMRIVGAIYLAYLGVRIAYYGFTPPQNDPGMAVSSLWRSYRQGLLTSLSNPKALIFFMALLPQFIDPEHFAFDIVYFGGLKMLCLAVVLGAYGWIGEQVFEILRRRNWAGVVSKILGGGIILAALALLWG